MLQHVNRHGRVGDGIKRRDLAGQEENESQFNDSNSPGRPAGISSELAPNQRLPREGQEQAGQQNHDVLPKVDVRVILGCHHDRGKKGDGQKNSGSDEIRDSLFHDITP